VFFLCLVLAAVIGVILYRMVIVAIIYGSTDDGNLIKSRVSFISTTTAACINLVIIIVLSFIYQKIALFLTKFEQLLYKNIQSSFHFKIMHKIV